MSLSRRLRFEILRRDNHTCRYCGATAPDVKLTVDHVIPVTLGGLDEPSNLVAACVDCNAGKSSISPDSKLVADVAEDAIRWAAAMAKAAESLANDRAVEELDLEWCYDEFQSRFDIYLAPADWKHSIGMLYRAGLTPDEIGIATAISEERRPGEFRYFCGVAWKMLNEKQALALQMLAVD